MTEDWPHFLGPHHNATTRETRLLETWPPDGPARVWEYATGEGYACPILAEGRLVYFHRVGNRETLDCLDPETGRRHWRFDYPVEYEDRYGYSPGPRSSAVIAGGRVYAAGVTAMLHCLDLATGKLIWKRDLAVEYRIPQYFFGYGPTPFAWRDRLIVTVGGKAADGGAGTGVAAFDLITGRTLWETADVWGASYASPIVARLQGRDVVLAMLGGGGSAGPGRTADARSAGRQSPRPLSLAGPRVRVGDGADAPRARRAPGVHLRVLRQGRHTARVRR